jgi:hypothetical protein
MLESREQSIKSCQELWIVKKCIPGFYMMRSKDLALTLVLYVRLFVGLFTAIYLG